MSLSRGGFELNEVWARQAQAIQESEEHPPFEGTAWREPPRTQEKQRERERQQKGDKGAPAVYGPGQYFSLSREANKTYTDDPRPHTVRLEKPYHIRDSKHDREIREKARTEYAGKGGEDIAYPFHLSEKGQAAFGQWFRDRGHDGIVVHHEKAPGGHQAIIFDPNEKNTRAHSFAERFGHMHDKPEHLQAAARQLLARAGEGGYRRRDVSDFRKAAHRKGVDHKHLDDETIHSVLRHEGGRPSRWHYNRDYGDE